MIALCILIFLVWFIASSIASNFIGSGRWWTKIVLAPWVIVMHFAVKIPVLLQPIIWFLQPWQDLAEGIELWAYNQQQKRLYKYRCKLHVGEQIYIPYRIPVETQRADLNFSGWASIVKVEEYWVTLEAYGREIQWTLAYLYDRVKK